MNPLCLVGLVFLGFIGLGAADEPVPVPGGIYRFEGDCKEEAKDLLDSSLAKLARKDGPKYKSAG